MEGVIDDRQLRVTRTLNAPVQLVWDVWTKPEHIVNWWAPAGFTTIVRRMIVAEGEEWLLTLQGPDGKTYPNKAIYREVKPLEKLVYEHFNPDFVGTATLKSEGNTTMIEWTMDFETKEMLDIIVKTFKADVGLQQNADKLVDYLADIC
jgi:uncharacterized protein YndB with AHSA1/START domain